MLIFRDLEKGDKFITFDGRRLNKRHVILRKFRPTFSRDGRSSTDANSIDSKGKIRYIQSHQVVLKLR